MEKTLLSIVNGKYPTQNSQWKKTNSVQSMEKTQLSIVNGKKPNSDVHQAFSKPNSKQHQITPKVL